MKNAKRRRVVGLGKRNVRRARRNQGGMEGADFPVGEVVDVEAIRMVMVSAIPGQLVVIGIDIKALLRIPAGPVANQFVLTESFVKIKAVVTIAESTRPAMCSPPGETLTGAILRL